MSRRASSVSRAGRPIDIDVTPTIPEPEEPALEDFPTRVAALAATVATWHRHAQASASVITAEVGTDGTGVNTSDLATQVGDLITDSSSVSDPSTMTIGQMSGGGNILEGDVIDAPHKITDLVTLNCGMCRISAASPANQYFQGETPSPENFDDIVVALLEAGIKPYFSFVFTDHLDSSLTGIPARNYADWFDIGAAFAARFKAGSSFLVGQGITDLGVYGYSAINEPDVDSGEILPDPPTTFGLTYTEYHNMLEGLADGVHSEEPDGKVFPSGYLSGNRDSEYTGHGYCDAIADLINDGTLAGFDLHTYHSKTGAKIHDTWGRSHQHDVDAFITACGITRQDIDIICTETNVRGDPDATTQDYTTIYPSLTNEEIARNWFLTSMFDVWGTLRPDGELAQGPRFPWQLWTSGNVVFHMASQEDPRIELWCGHTYKMLMDLVWDMRITSSDPRDTGVMKLQGGGKTAWVFQNIHSSWSSLSGSTFTISDLPAGTTQVEVYDGNGLIETVSTPTLQVPSHEFSTPTGKSYLFVANSSASGGSSMAFGASSPAAGGYTIPAPFQSAAYWVFFRIQLDAVPTTDMMLDTIGQGDNIDGEGAHKIIPDGAGGATVRMEAMGPAGFSRKDGASPGSIPVGKSIGLLFQRTAGDMKVYVGDEDGNFVEATMAYSVGTAQTWGATPNDVWHVGYFPAAGGSLQSNGFNGLMQERISGPGVILEDDIASLMASPGQTVVAARDVTLPDVTEGEGPITTSIGRSINPETGTTISLIAPNAAHSTVVVQGQALEVTPGSVSGDEADSQGFQATHAAGVAAAIASYDVLNAGSSLAYLPYRGTLYGSVWHNQNHGNDRLRNNTPGDGFFFYAPKTGNIVAMQAHERIDPGYSEPEGAGDHGNYTPKLWPANPTTRRPITTGSPICQATSYAPTSSANNQYPLIPFDSPGAVTAGQPYFLAYEHTNGLSAYFSQNHVFQVAFAHQTDTLTPTNYVEPGDGPGVGSINVASGGVDPENPGSVAARVAGWTPFKVGGVAQVVGRFTTQDGDFDRRCGGCYEASFVYDDGDVAGFGCWGGGGAGDQRMQPGGIHAYRILMSDATNHQIRERFRVTRENVEVSGVFIRAVRGASSSGSLRVRLEAGPTTETHFPSSNGILIEEFVAPASLFLPIPNVTFERHEQAAINGALDLGHFVWIPVSSTNHILTVGTQYTLRVYAVGGAEFAIQGNTRADHIGHSPTGRAKTWDQWEADRKVSGEAFEDCRDGAEYSTNDGATWQPMYGSGVGVIPLVLKRE